MQRSDSSVSELPDDLIPEWMWTLGDTSAPAALATTHESAMQSDVNTTVRPSRTSRVCALTDDRSVSHFREKR